MTIISDKEKSLLHRYGEAIELAEMFENSATKKHEEAGKLSNALYSNFDGIADGEHIMEDSDGAKWMVTVINGETCDISKINKHEMDYDAGL